MEEPDFNLALFGNPVEHSLSPRIHHLFAEQLRLKVEYWAHHIAEGAFEIALQRFEEEGGMGLNVTVPYKALAASFCCRLDAMAKVTGVVNTMVATEQGWVGDNTDGDGLLWDMVENLKWPMRGREVYVIGAGGAAAGVVPALLESGVGRITIASRRLAQAQGLIDKLVLHKKERLSACSLAELTLKPDCVVVNATSCGHHGTCPDLPEPPAGTLAYDLNYGEVAEPFLQWAKERDLTVSDGLGMLVGQAACSFVLWTGRTPEPRPVLQQIRDVIAEREWRKGIKLR